MKNIVLAFLFFCCFTTYIVADYTACDTSCDANGNADCDITGGTGATAPAGQCIVCEGTLKAKGLTSTATYGTCTAIATGCALDLPKIYIVGTDVYYCAALADVQTGFYKQCTTTKQAIASNIYANVAAYQIDCVACASDDQTMVITAAGDTKGYCVDKTATGATSPCATDTMWLKTTVATDATVLSFCATIKCAVCTASAGGAGHGSRFNFATAEYSFASEPTDRSYTCVTGGEKSLSTASTNNYGTCAAIAACSTATLPHILIASDVHYCAALADIETTFYKACTTTKQTIATNIYATINAYQVDCVACAGSDQTMVITAAADTKGYCVDKTATGATSPCATATMWLKTTVATDATVLSFCGTIKCAVCTASAGGAGHGSRFNFATAEYSFASEPTDRSYTCATGGEKSLSTASANHYGTCAAAVVACSDATLPHILIASDVHYCAALTDIQTTFYKACTTTKLTIATNIYATINAYQTDCANCASTGQTLVVTGVGSTNGYCIDKTIIQTTAPCSTATDWLEKVVVTSALATWCANTATPRCAKCSAQSSSRCSVFGFNANEYTFASEPSNKCSDCLNSDDIILLPSSGALFGTCTETAALVKSACDATAKTFAIYDTNPSSNTLSYCGVDSQISSKCAICTVINSCKTFYNQDKTDTWLDNTPMENCVECESGFILIVKNIKDQFGTCVNWVTETPCPTGQYVRKISGFSSDAGICLSTTITGNKQPCKNYYYDTSKYLDLEPAVAINKCSSCDAGQLFLLASPTDLFGKCYTNNPVALQSDIGGINYFLQFTNTQGENLNNQKVIVSNAPCCKTFNYALNGANTMGAYRDIFEARNDCNLCADGYIKITSSFLRFKHCELSLSCATYSASSFESFELAEKSCSTCNQGYFLQLVTGATAGVCVPLEGYLTFEGAATGFASADAAKIKGKTCAAAAGYLLIKAAPADIFGTCTVSTNCLTSTAVSPITIAAFELLCTICKPGFYKVTLAAGDVTTNPCGPIPDAANCLQAKDIVLTAETVAANCELCKAGYFPLKAAGVNAFGTCTLITKKQTCLEYTVGAALDQDAALLAMKCTKCPSEFYYLYGGKCYRCNDDRASGNTGCKTCLPTPMTVGTFTDAIFCTSCQQGSFDFVLFTGGWFGQCSACDSSCRTCSATFVNTSPDNINRKCESCIPEKYFALEAEFESGFCQQCDSKQQNCFRCSSAGLCAQCKTGYFLNLNEMQCDACKTDCDVCKDRVSCIKSACIPGCAECTAKDIAGCSKCAAGTYKSDTACVSCALNCLECTASGCTTWSPLVKGASCATNCYACSAAAGTVVECTTPVWGQYIDKSVEATPVIRACIDGCKLCSSGVYADCSECKPGYFKNDKGKVCEACHSDCARCNGATMNECLECKSENYPSFVLQTFQGASSGYCAFCDFNLCKTCGGKAPHQEGACTSCWGSWVIAVGYVGPLGTSGKCIEKCLDDTFQEGIYCKRCILGSPAPCPQPPPSAAATTVVSASYLTLPILLIAFIIMLL